jgi:hypothetical protein
MNKLQQKPNKKQKSLIFLSIIVAVMICLVGLTAIGAIPNPLDLLTNLNDRDSAPSSDDDLFKKCMDDNSDTDYCMQYYFPSIDKPVIYLYPTKTEIVSVNLDFSGDLTLTYPEYDNGWEVEASPDGSLINLRDNKEYSYLYWEGVDNGAKYDMSSGFIVRGSETAEFLQDSLSKLGLIPKEYNEFIVYWLPQMINNKYNLIHFASKSEYDDRAILNIKPTPDSILRVFMVFKSLSDNNIHVKAQEIKGFDRKGFAVVEWGGTEIR